MSAFLMTGCSTVASRPCSKGGQPAFDDGRATRGTKQCFQVKAGDGKYVNQGKYVEWHPNGVRAIEGEYASGVKTGKWIEWDEQGRKVAEKWYEAGNRVPGREAQPYNGLGIAPRPVVKAEGLQSLQPQQPQGQAAPGGTGQPSGKK